MSTRPKFISGKPKFFICRHCNNLVVQERAENVGAQYVCCGRPMDELWPNTVDAYSKEHLPVITFIGGFSANTAKVKVGSVLHPMTEEHHIEWVYLRTAQGGQFKRLTLGKDPLVTFALADEDAYAYCDRPICINCKFKCKHGFAAYAYCNLHGLWETQV